MYLAYTYLDINRSGWLVIRQTRTRRDVLAALAVELYERHEPGRRVRCLVDPPAWTYRLGGHYRWSLGGLLWRAGQWAHGRTGAMPEVVQQPVTTEVLVERFGWSPDDLRPSA
jgi:hypothetical protein